MLPNLFLRFSPTGNRLLGGLLPLVVAALLIAASFATAGAQTLNISGGVQTFTSLSNTTVTMTGSSELFVTSSTTPLTSCVINLNSVDSWLFLTGVIPSSATSYLSQVTVNGAAAAVNTNVRVVQYGGGTVIIPQSSSYQPLQVFTGPNFTGSSTYLNQYTAYNTSAALGAFSDSISSFKLKRGYLATLSQNSDGTGTSVCYVAADGDIDISVLPSGLRNNVSAVFVYPWRWVTKKGTAGNTGDNGALNLGWWYDWNIDQNSSSSVEYVPIRQNASWPSLSGQNWKSRGSNSLMGYNEPDQSSQANMSVASGISVWPVLLATGLRVGAPATADGASASWLYPFMTQAAAKNYRVDFVSKHYYQCHTPSDAAGCASQLYNELWSIWQTTHKPLWITEFNNGANWTTCGDPTSAQQNADLTAMIQMLDSTPFVERYAIYNWVENSRAVVLNGGRTAAGVSYANESSPIGYNQILPSNNTRGIMQLKLDGNTVDTSGFGNNGIAVGTPTYKTGVNSRPALVLDGTNTHVVLPGNLANLSTFTFAAWVYWNGGASWQRIFDFGDDTSNFLFLTPKSASGTMRFGIEVNGTQQTLDTTALTPGIWTHVVVTMDGSATNLYVNGSLAATTTAISNDPSQIKPMYNYIGKSQFAADPHFSGMIEDIRMKDYALPASSISGLMNDNPPAFSSTLIDGGSAAQGQPYNFSIAGAASDPGDTISYSIATGPTWLKVSTSGVLSGTPTGSDQGTEYATISASDSSGAEGTTVVAIHLPIINGSGVWALDTSGTWSDNTMWAGGTIANGAGYNADFSTLNIAASRTVDMDSSRSIANLKFGDTSGTSGWTLTADSGGELTLDTGGTTSPSIVVNQGSAIISLSLGGVNGFIKTGAGQLVLNGGNSISGILYIDSASTSANDGSFCIASAGAVDQVSSPIYIRNNNSGSSILQFDGSNGDPTVGQDISLAGRNTTVPSLENISGTSTLSGNISLGAGGSNYFVQSDSGIFNLAGNLSAGTTGSRIVTLQGGGSGDISGSVADGSGMVGLTISSSGSWVLSGINSYTGPTTLNAGTLEVDGSIVSGGTLTTSTGTILTGTGSIGANTVIAGVHNLGLSGSGTQTFTSSLTYNATANLNWTLVANSADPTAAANINGQTVTVNSGALVNLIFDGPGCTVDFTNSFWSVSHVWTLASATVMSGQFTLGNVSQDANGVAISAYGNFTLQQTPSGVSIAYFPLTAQPPGPGSGLSSTGNNGNVNLTWAPASGAVSYIVERSTVSGGPYSIIATGVAGTNYVDTTVGNGVTYYYVILGANGNGTGQESQESRATPHLPAAIIKADNTNNLSLSTSWLGTVIPNVNDIARWSGLASSNSVVLGGNLGVQGLSIGSTGGAVSIGGTSTLTVGIGGVDMSQATQNLSIGGGLAIGQGTQMWNVPLGRTLSLASGTFTRPSGATLSVQGAGNFPNAMSGLGNDASFGNGLIPWATSGTGGNTRFLSVSAGSLVAYTSGSAVAGFNWTSSNPSTINYDVAATAGALGVTRAANTVRYTGAAGTQGIGSSDTTLCPWNALMNAGSGSLAISQNSGLSGLVASTGGGELILFAANGPLSISAPIYNAGATTTGATSNVVNGGTTSSVTIVGPNAVTLSGSNMFSGGLTLASGTAILSNNSGAGTGPITLGSGVLTSSGARVISNALQSPLGCSVTILSASASNLDLGGNLSGGGSLSLSGSYGTSTVRMGGLNLGFSGIICAAGPNVRLYSASAGSASANWIVNGGLQLDVSGANSFALGTLSGTGNITGHFAQSTSQTQTLTVGALGADCTFGGTITDNAVNSSSSGNQDSASLNVLALTKVGSGSLTLTGTSTYSGLTSVSSGNLVLNGALFGHSTISVGSGATLSGTGLTSGSVTVASGGTVSPGTSGVGAFTTYATLTFTNGSILNSQIGGSGTSTLLVASSGVSATGTTVINLSPLAGFGPGTYPIISSAVNINAANFVVGSAPANFTYSLSANNGTLSVSIAPAGPSTIEAWRQKYFGTSTDSGAAANDADPQGDGVCNLLKYAIGANPSVPWSGPCAVIGTTPDGTTLTLTFHRITDPTLTYQVLVSDDLANWTVIWESTGSQNVIGNVTVTDVDAASNHTSRFLKLSVSQ